jgi:hypothetical protein
MLGFRGADPAEALSLARLGLQRLDGHPVAAAADELVAHSQEQLGQPFDQPGVALYGAMAAQILCGTPGLPLA